MNLLIRCPVLTLSCLWLFTFCTGVIGGAPAENADDWIYLDNGQVRLGVKKTSGAGIGWFSASGSARNLINDWDCGRLVQQSYYGRKDGSLWNKKPWTWNPVQGGDWRGHGAQVLELKLGTNSLYAKTLPKHWASGVNLPDVTMEEWISLTNKVAHVHFKLTYTGTNVNPVTSQEVPAFFVEPDLSTLVLYDGKQPWANQPLQRTQPGWPNESRRIAEHWAAYVDTNDFGVGALVPVADQITCYRFGDGKREHGACSYFAPVVKFAITPGKVFAYDVFLTLGGSAEIRKTFQMISPGLSGITQANKPSSKKHDPN
jgi:hypothetical protein